MDTCDQRYQVIHYNCNFSVKLTIFFNFYVGHLFFKFRDVKVKLRLLNFIEKMVSTSE